MRQHVADPANPPEPLAPPRSALRWTGTLAVAVIAGAMLAAGLALRAWLWQRTMPLHPQQVLVAVASPALANWIATIQSGQWKLLATPIAVPNFSSQLILQLNTIAEALAAMLVFVMTRYWVRRSQLARPRLRITPSTSKVVPTRAEPDPRIAPPADHAHWWALAAAALIWFNPAALVDGHIALNTTIWIVPLYLAAIFAASTNFWFVAGLLLSLAAAINGMVYLVAPVFIVWPLLQRRLGATLRFALGFAAMLIILALPQLAPNREAWVWLLCLVACAAAFAPFGYPNPGIGWLVVAIATMGLLNWQWLNRENVTDMYMSLTISAALLVGPWWLAKKASPFWIVFIAMIGALVAARRFGGNADLLIQHLPWIAPGHAANLPAVLWPVMGWNSDSPVIFHAWIDVTPKILFGMICGVSLLLCAAGAAIHQHRDDPQLLLALATPWVILFALDPHNNQQFLVIAAAISAVSVAASTGMMLMHLLFATLAGMMVMLPMLTANPKFTPHLLSFIKGMDPSIGWMVGLIAAVYLFQAIAPRARPPVVKVIPAFVRAARGR